MRTLLCLFLIAPLSAAASQLPDFPFVYVFGSAHRGVAPDQATISFRVKTYDTLASEAYRKQSEVAGSVLAFAEKMGLRSQDITAQAIEKSTVRKKDERGTSYEIVGYEATRRVDVRVEDLKRFPEVIEFLYGATNVDGIRANFWRKDSTTIIQDLTRDAATAAKEKAHGRPVMSS